MSKSILSSLDSSLYPQVWEQQTFTSPQALLLSMLNNEVTVDASAFTKQLLANNIYKEWINTTVFGRYLHRNFTAFYQQTEDSFNIDMPSLFRQELMRHTQYLPLTQVLFLQEICQKVCDRPNCLPLLSIQPLRSSMLRNHPRHQLPMPPE